jgi:hypothetical protein
LPARIQLTPGCDAKISSIALFRCSVFSLAGVRVNAADNGRVNGPFEAAMGFIS